MDSWRGTMPFPPLERGHTETPTRGHVGGDTWMEATLELRIQIRMRAGTPGKEDLHRVAK